MFGLFALDVVIKGQMLMSIEKKQSLNVEVKEYTGLYPYRVTVESSSSGLVHGKESYSFNHLEDAYKRFSELIVSYCNNGYYKKSA